MNKSKQENKETNMEKEFHHVSEYYKFFKETYKQFNKVNKHNKNTYIDKSELLSKMPQYLKSTDAKKRILNKWTNKVTEKDFIELLMKQTGGIDYANLDYLIIKYDLTVDKNYMIKFTDEFPFNNKIKKEALFIWGILNAIKNDKLLSKYISSKDLVLQNKYETNVIQDKYKFKYDALLMNMNIVVEIDENHDKQTRIKDAIKNTIAEMNGNVLARLDFQKIYCNIIYKNGEKFYKGKGEIPNNKDANNYLLDSEYYGEFIQDLINKIYSSLFGSNKEFRDDYIMYLLKLSIEESINNTNKIIDKCKEKQLFYSQVISLDNSVKKKYLELETKFKNLEGIKSKTLKYFNTILKLVNKSSGKFIQLFNIKHESYNDSKDLNSKNIKLEKIIELLSIEKIYHTKFIESLYRLHLDIDVYEDDNNILLSWKDLSNIIMNSLEVDSILRDALNMYYRELENSYEYILKRIKEFDNIIIGDEIKYDIITDIIESKIQEKNDNIISSLNNKITTLEKRIENKNKEYNLLDKKYKSLGKSYYFRINNDMFHRVNSYYKYDLAYLYDKSVRKIQNNSSIEYDYQDSESDIQINNEESDSGLDIKIVSSDDSDNEIEDNENTECEINYIPDVDDSDDSLDDDSDKSDNSLDDDSDKSDKEVDLKIDKLEIT